MLPAYPKVFEEKLTGAAPFVKSKQSRLKAKDF